MITGLDAETADINNVVVQLGDASVEPRYVAPAADHAEAMRIEFDIPANEPEGPCPMTIRLKSGFSSPFTTIEVAAAPALVPSIVLVSNDKDGGLDVESTGPKSHVRLFVDGISAWPDWQRLNVLLGQERLSPYRITFVPGNGLHLVGFALPDLLPGDVPVALVLDDCRSASVTLHVKREPMLARLGRLAPKRLQRAIERVKELRPW